MSNKQAIETFALFTVAAPNCTEAGILTTLAILQGDKAEEFLEQNERPYWLQF